MKTGAKIAGTAGAAIVLCLLLALLLKPREPVPPPLPSPNGHDDFVKAGKLVKDTMPTPDAATNTLAELRAFVNRNQEALALVREGFAHECRVPVVYSEKFPEMHLPDVAALKHMAQTLRVEGRLAEMENRTGDAARIYVDIIRLGHEGTRGGLLIDALVGMACEAIGTTPLYALLSTLDAPTCKELTKRLEQVDRQRESAAEVMRREKMYGRKVGGVRFVMARLVAPQMYQQSEQAYRGKLSGIEAQRRRLIVDLATRAYELETGKKLDNTNDLVPKYLQRLDAPK